MPQMAPRKGPWAFSPPGPVVWQLSAAASARSAQEITDHGGDALNLRAAQLGMNRQGQDLARRTFGVRMTARPFPEVRKAHLHVQWHRIIDLAADALLVQAPLQRSAER